MQKFIFAVFAVTCLAASSYAGPVESSGQHVEKQTTYQPSEEWYRDREWNFDLFGSYSFTARPYRSDQYLGTDHGWGGGIDANFMFSRYLGIGVEGYGLAADDAIGQASGNLIFRYPIPGTRLAPYGYAGGGIIFDDSRIEDLVARGRGFQRDRDAEAIGQFGAGFEFRLTPNVGLINDFSWNIVNGDRNDFGMVRSGVRFGF